MDRLIDSMSRLANAINWTYDKQQMSILEPQFGNPDLHEKQT